MKTVKEGAEDEAVEGGASSGRHSEKQRQSRTSPDRRMQPILRLPLRLRSGQAAAAPRTRQAQSALQTAI